jgi:anti-anti-sigma factor
VTSALETNLTIAEGGLKGLDVVTTLSGNLAILVVSGVVDTFTTPSLATQLKLAIDGGARSVVVDLAAVTSIGVAGFTVIVSAVRRLVQLDGRLTIRSPSPFVCRVLNIVGLAELARIETEEDPSHPGFGQSAGSLALPVETRSARTRSTASGAAFDERLIDKSLRLVVALARVTIGGTDGVSVVLRRRGVLATVAASDQTTVDTDADQYATGEGPCIDASVEGRWFRADSLSTESRWPAFTPKAQTLGIHAILSSPLFAGREAVGALNIYSRSPGTFTSKDQDLASVFAAEASVILTEAGADNTDDALAERFWEALRSRRVIAIAKGVIMERDGVSEADAFATLRRYAVWAGIPLLERAQDVVVSSRAGVSRTGHA